MRIPLGDFLGDFLEHSLARKFHNTSPGLGPRLRRPSGRRLGGVDLPEDVRDAGPPARHLRHLVLVPVRGRGGGREAEADHHLPLRGAQDRGVGEYRPPVDVSHPLADERPEAVALRGAAGGDGSQHRAIERGADALLRLLPHQDLLRGAGGQDARLAGGMACARREWTLRTGGAECTQKH
eukprot:gene1680-biopygen5228